MATVGVNPVDISADSHHGSSSTDVNSGPDGSISSWLPGIEDIRAAHLAQASALETVVASLAAKHQSSITALRCDLDALALTLKTARAAQQRVAAAPGAQATDPARVAEIGKGAGAKHIGEMTLANVGDITDEMIVTEEAGDGSILSGAPGPSQETLKNHQPPPSENKEQQWQQGTADHPRKNHVSSIE